MVEYSHKYVLYWESCTVWGNLAFDAHSVDEADLSYMQILVWLLTNKFL